MKKMLCALLAVALSACLLFSGCGLGGSAVPNPPYEIPGWLAEKEENAQLREESAQKEKKEIQVDFFYDNTQSMDGYVRDTGLQYGQPDGTLVRALAALRNINREYSAAVYTMQPDGSNILRWAEYTDSLYDNFSQKDFYTYTGNLYEGQGPLRSLFFGEGIVNPENINVFVTDLCEQGVNNAELAHHINDTILSQEGYAAAIIAMKLDFNGVPSAPDPDTVNSMSDPNQVVHQERPYYIILTGPYDYLSSYLSDFQENFKEAVEGEDYFLSVYYPESGVEKVEVQDIRTPGVPEYMEEITEDVWDNPEFPVNLNLSVQRIADTDVQQLFATDDYLDLFAFRYLSPDNDQNVNKSQRMVLNFFVPIRTEEGGTADVSFRVGNAFTPTGDAEVDELLEQKETLTYSYLRALTQEELDSAWEASPDEEIPDYSWEQLTTQLDLDNQIQVTWEKELVRAGDLLEFGESDLLPGYQAQPLFSEEDYTDGLEPDTMGIHIQVETGSIPPKMAGSTIVFNLPIYAVSLTAQDMDLPAWVEEFDAGDTKDYVGRTYNLDIFYKTLFGLTNRDNPELMRTQREAKIADLTVAVTDLPVRQGS